MKTTRWMVVLFALVPLSGFTQQSREVDVKELLESPNDTHKVNLMLEIIRNLVPDSLALADELANEAIEAAREIKFRKGLIHAQRAKGLVADYDGNLIKALKWYDEALSLCGDDPLWERERISLALNKGVAYYYAGEDGKALENYIQAEAYCTKPSCNDYLAKIFNNMAVVYRKLERIEDAIRIYEKSLQLKRKVNDSLGMANTLNNIGISYGYLKEYDQSVHYLNQAKKIYEELEEKSEALSVELSLAFTFSETGRIEQAITLLQETLSSEELKIKMFDRVQQELLLAKLYCEMENFKEARDLLAIVYPKLENKSFLEALQSYFYLSAAANYGVGEVDAAYHNLLDHKYLTDTIVEVNRLELEEEMQTKYLTKEKEAQIEIQKLQLAKNRRERLLFILALSGLGLILLLVYFFYRQRQKANQMLSSKNAQIQKALKEKEILLKEIHHRVKNNLQIISSLLSLQSRQIEDPRALEAIREGRNRVNSMALIHKNLYQEENLVGVDAADYIDKLTDSLMANYQISEQNIAIKKDIDPLQLDVDVVIPLGLILNELITNSLKYAFGENEKGQISMSLKKEKEGIRLRVEDNGKGLPEGFDFERLSSLGFRLIKAFSQKLEGVLNISSSGGTQVDLFIPKFKLT